MSSLGPDKANTHMLKAALHHKKVTDEQIQIQARIVKLKKEQERATKRINDM